MNSSNSRVKIGKLLNPLYLASNSSSSAGNTGGSGGTNNGGGSRRRYLTLNEMDNPAPQVPHRVVPPVAVGSQTSINTSSTPASSTQPLVNTSAAASSSHTTSQTVGFTPSDAESYREEAQNLEQGLKQTSQARSRDRVLGNVAPGNAAISLEQLGITPGTRT